MITNKEIFLKKIDSVIEDYKKIIQTRSFSKRKLIKNNIKVFTSKSVLCDDIQGIKICERTPNGCFLWSQHQGCSRSATFIKKKDRSNLNFYKLRLQFYKEVKSQCQNLLPSWYFLKKNRASLHYIIDLIDKRIFKAWIMKQKKI